MNEALLILMKELKKTSNSDTEKEIMRLAYTSVIRMSSEKPAEIPSWFIHHYEVDYNPEPFAQGSFGRVHYGKYLGHTPVVVKVLLVDTNPRERIKFEKEMKLWSSLSHRFVLKMYGGCHVSSPPFIVCEEAKNGTLDEYCAKYPKKTISLLYQAAQGLAYLHEKNIVHGDLKCNNILVSQAGEAKLTDFGFSYVRAKSSSIMSAQQNNNQTGAVRWKAPECIRGAKSSFAADTFSFGMCIYEAVTGEVPFEHVVEEAIVMELIPQGKLPEKPSIEVMSDELWDLITKMCKLVPVDRIDMRTVLNYLRDMVLPDDDGVEKIICDACMSPNDPLNRFCKDCGKNFFIKGEGASSGSAATTSSTARSGSRQDTSDEAMKYEKMEEAVEPEREQDTTNFVQIATPTEKITTTSGTGEGLLTNEAGANNGFSDAKYRRAALTLAVVEGVFNFVAAVTTTAGFINFGDPVDTEFHALITLTIIAFVITIVWIVLVHVTKRKSFPNPTQMISDGLCALVLIIVGSTAAAGNLNSNCTNYSNDHCLALRTGMAFCFLAGFTFIGSAAVTLRSLQHQDKALQAANTRGAVLGAGSIVGGANGQHQPNSTPAPTSAHHNGNPTGSAMDRDRLSANQGLPPNTFSDIPTNDGHYYPMQGGFPSSNYGRLSSNQQAGFPADQGGYPLDTGGYPAVNQSGFAPIMNQQAGYSMNPQAGYSMNPQAGYSVNQGEHPMMNQHVLGFPNQASAFGMRRQAAVIGGPTMNQEAGGYVTDQHAFPMNHQAGFPINQQPPTMGTTPMDHGGVPHGSQWQGQENPSNAPYHTS